MLNRIVAVKVCNATGDEKNYQRWLQIFHHTFKITLTFYYSSALLLLFLYRVHDFHAYPRW